MSAGPLFPGGTPLSVAFAWAAAVAAAAYAVGSIPFAYLIVRVATGEDISTHGSGNVGAMNVRRTTGSWGWFALAAFADVSKGFVPTALAKWATGLALFTPVATHMSETGPLDALPAALLPMAALFGAVLGHNYSAWLALLKHRFARTGKGLATGAGALTAYDWRYFLVVVAIGLLMIALTRYMMAGQVAAALALPVTALVLRAPDWPFALLAGGIVYGAHHKRFVGMLRGEEPRLYIHDRQGPRG